MLLSPDSPAYAVQRQLDAFNARNIDALMATYAEDAVQVEPPATVLARGHAEIRARMTQRFAEPNLHARILQRAVMGHVVIDHEIVTRTFPEGAGWLEVVAVYHVREGRIASLSLTPINKWLESGK